VSQAGGSSQAVGTLNDQGSHDPDNPWSRLIGHQQPKAWFACAIAGGRLSGSFLLVGSAGIGKETFANLLAQTLLCEQNSPQTMHPCGRCEGCIQVVAGTHCDLIRVRKPADKSLIPLDLLIGRPEARMQEGFCRDIRLRPFRGRHKVAILHDADFLNEEGANCLLKTLEEPPADAVVMLIGTSEQRQLPTIRSRCRVVRFASPSGSQAAKLLRDVHGLTSASDEEIDLALEMAAGDLQVAVRMLGGEFDQFQQAFTAQLAAPHPDPLAICRIINKHVEAAGKEASQRRSAMRDVFSLAIQYYRRQLRQAAVTSSISIETLARLDRSIRAIHEVDRSANQASLIECYASDIASAITADLGQIG